MLPLPEGGSNFKSSLGPMFPLYEISFQELKWPLHLHLQSLVLLLPVASVHCTITEKMLEAQTEHQHLQCEKGQYSL